MRKGESHSRRGISVVLVLFLFGAALQFSVPVTLDASSTIQMPDTTNEKVLKPTSRKHQDSSWDLQETRPLQDFQLNHWNFETTSGDMIWESRTPLDLIPSGTPHAPITIDDNLDFLKQLGVIEYKGFPEECVK